jgi:hypothetical protein
MDAFPALLSGYSTLNSNYFLEISITTEIYIVYTVYMRNKKNTIKDICIIMLSMRQATIFGAAGTTPVTLAEVEAKCPVFSFLDRKDILRTKRISRQHYAVLEPEKQIYLTFRAILEKVSGDARGPGSHFEGFFRQIAHRYGVDQLALYRQIIEKVTRNDVIDEVAFATLAKGIALTYHASEMIKGIKKIREYKEKAGSKIAESLLAQPIYPIGEELSIEELTRLEQLLADFGKIPIRDLDMDSLTVNTESHNATHEKRIQLQLTLGENRVLIGVETSKETYTRFTYANIENTTDENYLIGTFLRTYIWDV